MKLYRRKYEPDQGGLCQGFQPISYYTRSGVPLKGFQKRNGIFAYIYIDFFNSVEGIKTEG